MMVLLLILFHPFKRLTHSLHTSGTKVVRFGEDARRHAPPENLHLHFPLPPKTHRGPSNPVHSSAISMSEPRDQKWGLVFCV